MPSSPDVNKLHTALDSYGVKAKRLDAALLEFYKDVPIALFGEEAWADVSQRQIMSERTEEALRHIIEDMPEADRLIAEVIWATRQEFYGQTVTTRLRGLHIDNRFKERRPIIVKLVTAELWRKLGPGAPRDQDVLLSPKARRAARQLYRYAQKALVAVEAFDLCIDFAKGIQGKFRWARYMQVDLKYIAHGWLGAYERDGESFRLAPISRCAESDSALWALAYCHRYLRALLGDQTGRDYLRENVSTGRWLRIQVGIPFRPDEIDKMLLVLARVDIDDSSLFVDDLREDNQGRIIHELWLELLTTEVYEHSNEEEADPCRLTMSDRSRIASDLLEFCMILQHISPEETIYSLHDASWSAIYSIIYGGLLESGTSDVDYEQLDKLVDDLLWRRPPRYLKGEPLTWPLPASYFSGQKGQTPWNDDRPEHDPWAEFH